MKENSTRSGIELSPVYGPKDSNGDYEKRFGDPGKYPFTRGTRSYSGQGWIQRELSGEGDAKRSNEQFKYLMGLGQNGLDVIGDSLTEINVTSPTCFQEIFDQTGFDVAAMFMDALEQALKA